MEKFAAGTDCVLTYNLEENGYTDVTKVTWQLVNAKGENLTSGVLYGEEPTPPEETTQAENEDNNEPVEENVLSWKIEARYNNIEENKDLDYRRVILNITDSNSTSIVFIEYLLVGTVELTPMVNSYQTYGEAQLTAAKISGLQDWELVPTEDKISALITAYKKIGKLNFVIPGETCEDTVEISNLNSLTVEEFEALDPAFVDAIKRAQVVEANSVSGYNAAEEMKRNNILSYTIGETSQMFKTGNTYVSYLSSDVMDILSGYVVRKMRIARSS